jgi:hypothetical protein
MFLFGPLPLQTVQDGSIGNVCSLHLCSFRITSLPGHRSYKGFRGFAGKFRVITSNQAATSSSDIPANILTTL